MSSKTYTYLSYFLNGDTPLYGGDKGIDIIPDRQIKAGDSANTKKLALSNHAGTHIDFPNHFFEDAKLSHEYDASFWVFDNPFVLDIEVSAEEIILLSENQLAAIPATTDFLMLRTGFSKYRKEEKYWNNNPGLHPDLASLLRQKCSSLRILGVDFISITSFQDRILGRAAHRSFLGHPPILLVEDMRLDELHRQPQQVVCLPLLLEGADGAPVTVIAEL